VSAAITSVSLAIPGVASKKHATHSPEETLAASIETLAHLRYSVVLTASWEVFGDRDALRRRELHEDLERLHALYFDKIDRIAMAYGVQRAMDAKEDVERRITVPHSIRPAVWSIEEGEMAASEYGEFDI